MPPNLLDLISQAVLTVDSAGRVTQSNKAAASLLSRTTDALAGLCIEELIAMRDRPRFSELRKRISDESFEPVDETFGVVTGAGNEIGLGRIPAAGCKDREETWTRSYLHWSP